MAARLTDLKIKGAKKGRHVDGDVRGLCLVVTGNGSKSWVLRIVSGGKRRDIGLGGYPDVPLHDAREIAQRLRRVVKAGGDPIAERDRDKLHIPTFKEAAKECHKGKKDGWISRTADAFLSTLELHVFPSIGRLRVDSVTAADIATVLAPIWTTKPAAAKKLRQRIGIVLDFSQGRCWRISGMPRDGIRPLMAKQPKSKNFAATPYSDVPAFVATIMSQPATLGRLALLFTVFTAARSGETRSMKWSHVNLEARLWHRPRELMKQREPHSVTLSSGALHILEAAKSKRTTDVDCLVFSGSGGKPFSDMTLAKVMRVAGRSETVHGFRSSFRTWAAEKCPTIIVICLTRLQATKHLAAYLLRTTSLTCANERLRSKTLLGAWATI